MTTHNMAWEDVLAEVEADVRATEVALAAAKSDVGARRELAPAETMLPSGTTGAHGLPGPFLPPLSAMPPVPSELLDRIVELRNRIEALRVKMQAELLELQAASARIAAPRSAPARAAAAPRYVDCAL